MLGLTSADCPISRQYSCIVARQPDRAVDVTYIEKRTRARKHDRLRYGTAVVVAFVSQVCVGAVDYTYARARVGGLQPYFTFVAIDALLHAVRWPGSPMTGWVSFRLVVFGVAVGWPQWTECQGWG